MCTKRLRPEPPASSALAGSFPALDHLSNGTRRPGFRLRALASPDNIHLQNPSYRRTSREHLRKGAMTFDKSPPGTTWPIHTQVFANQALAGSTSLGGFFLCLSLLHPDGQPGDQSNHSKPVSRLPAGEGKKRSPHESMRARW